MTSESGGFRFARLSRRGGVSPALEPLEQRSMLAVTALNPIADSVVQIDAAASAISIAGRYDNTELNGTIARFVTDIGEINVLLYDQANPGVTRSTPLTVENFLRYVNDGRYEQTVFHRSVSGFVIQGGGFKRPDTDGVAPFPIPAFPSVNNEPGNTNTRGTIAMAKLGDQPNSATNQWFFNLGNNASNLDNQNGGFTVFGRVIKGLDVMDALAAVPVYNFGEEPFTQLPLRNHDDPQFVFASEYVGMNVSTTQELTYSVTSSDPALVGATLTGTDLALTYGAGRSGSAQITVRITCADGTTLDDVFTVRINSAPVLANLVMSAPVVDLNSPFTITVGTATDDAGIARVDFYRDTNDNGLLDTDTDLLLATDTSSETGWRADTTTAGLLPGTYRYFARATDGDGIVSNVITSTISVEDLLPAVVQLTATPTSVQRNQSVLLTASELVLPGGSSFKLLEFYGDTDGDATLDVGGGSGGDRKLGTAKKFTNGVITLNTSTKGLPAGLYTYFARVQTLAGVWLDPVPTTVTILNNAPTISSLRTQAVVKNLGDSIKLVPTGVSDSDGTVASVRVYRESGAAAEGVFDALTDTLIGTLTGSSAIRAGLTVSTAAFTTGTNRFYAVATDNDGRTGASVTTTTRINAAPTITSFTSTPTSGIMREQIFAFTVGGAADSDGTVKRVEFFYDLNGNATFDPGIDRALGNGKLSGANWTYSLKNKRLPVGTVTIFARATDNDGGFSAVRSLQLVLT